MMTRAERTKKIEELRGNDIFESICNTIASVEKFMKQDIEAGNYESLRDFLDMRQKLVVRWSEMTGFRYRSSSESKGLVVSAKQLTTSKKRRSTKVKEPDKRIIRIRTKNFERLSKHEAFLLLTNSKQPVYMFPNKVLPDNNWIMPTEIRPDEIKNKEDFNRIVDGFKFYNCNLPYLGTYVSFYKRAM